MGGGAWLKSVKNFPPLVCRTHRLSEKEGSRFLCQILNAVEYLHQIGITHRDLKPENLLLDCNNNIKGLSQICFSDAPHTALPPHAHSLLPERFSHARAMPPGELLASSFARARTWSHSAAFRPFCRHSLCVKTYFNLLPSPATWLSVVDFGLSNSYKDEETLKTACGSPCYAAPEMVSGKRYHGLYTDIWSCGIILFAMICGYLPFEDTNTPALYNKIMNSELKIPSFISDRGKSLLRGILQKVPQQRLTI